MFPAGLMALITQSTETPIRMSFPLVQLFLGSIGLCSMVCYALIRQRIVNREESEQQPSLATRLFPFVREWLGGHHGAASQVRAGSK